MKKITYLLIGLVFSFATTSCSDDDPNINVMPSEDVITPSTLTTPETTTFILAAETADDVAASFTWTAATGEYNGNMTYYVVASKAGVDFNFVNAKVLDASTADLMIDITHVQMNKPLIDLGLKAGEATEVELRIMSVLNLDKDFAFSAPITVTVTPYAMETGEVEVIPFYLVGGPNSWDINAPLEFLNKGENKYELFVNIADDDANGFKICSEIGNWDSCWKEDTENAGSLILEGGDPNISAPSAGFYLMEINMTEGEETITKTLINSWGVVGAAAGSWDDDVNMTYDATNNTWSVTLDMIAGEWKFRANDDWTIALGDENEDGILENTPGIPNLAWSEEGNFTITLSLEPAGNYTFTSVKN